MSEIGRASCAASRPASSNSVRARPLAHKFSLGRRRPDRRRRDGGEREPGLRDGAILAEPQPRPRSGDRDVHLASRRKAQVGAGRMWRDWRQSDRDQRVRPPRVSCGRAPRKIASTGISRMPSRPGNHGPRTVADQRRHAVRRRRGIADITAKARAVLHLHAANQLRRLGDGRIARHDGRMSRGGGRRHRRTDLHAAVGQQRDRRHLGDMFQVDDARGAPPPFAQLRHRSVPPASARASSARIAAMASPMVSGRS